jgi:hypothetical protein
MIYVLFNRLHLAGLTLMGRFGGENLIVDEVLDHITVRFGFLAEGAVERFTEAGGKLDIEQMKKVVTLGIFKGSVPGHELTLWLSLLGDGEIAEMMVDSVLLMSIESYSEKFSSLYDTYKTSSPTVKAFVQAELAEYNGWQKIITGKGGNTFLQETFEHKDKDGNSGARRYKDTVEDLLRLLRNSRQHEALHHGGVFALVVGHHFCNLIADLQRALHLARYNQIDASVIALPVANLV